jgi:branched-subunit amino acid ABC-type transport system permease component
VGHQLLLSVGFGLITASVLALAAVGVTLQFGVTNYVNFAYGSYMALGGFIAWTFNVQLGLAIWLAFLLAAAGLAVFSVIVNQIILHRFNRRNPPRVYMLILTLGLWLFLSNGIVAVWGPQIHTFNVANESPLDIGPFLLTPAQIAVFALALVVMLAVHLVLTRTRLGKAMRAMSDDSALAAASGIDADFIVRVTWVMVGILVGLSGCVLALNLGSFNPAYGDTFLFVIFSAVIVGGIGQVYGAMLGALVIGLATEVSAVFISSTYKSDFAFLVLIAVLLFRPRGLIASRGRQ